MDSHEGGKPLKRRLLLGGLGLLAVGGAGLAVTRRSDVENASISEPGLAAAQPVSSSSPVPPVRPRLPRVGDAPEIPSQASIVAEFSGQKASYWGEHAPASISRFTPVGRARQVALTFDACGGHALDYDSELIETLRRHRVSATLFINLRWAQAHPKTVSELAADPLFEVANHGHRHVPLSVSPRFAWGIPSTEDVGEVWSEIAENTQYLRQIGLEPAFMRPGTAYADDISAQIAVRLGTPIVSYSLNADGGATFTSAEVDAALSGVQPGDIVIGHFNRPGSGTAAGFSAALPRLLKRGFFFVQLSDAVNSA